MPWLDLDEELGEMFSGLTVNVARSESDGFIVRRRAQDCAPGLCRSCNVPAKKSRCERCLMFSNASIRAVKRWRRARGLCVTCRKPPIRAAPGRKQCCLCLADRRVHEKRIWDEYVSLGICTRCRGPREDANKVDCQSCRNAAVDRSRAQKLRNRAKGLCNCGNQRNEGYLSCSPCLDRGRGNATSKVGLRNPESNSSCVDPAT